VCPDEQRIETPNTASDLTRIFVLISPSPNSKAALASTRATSALWIYAEGWLQRQQFIEKQA
jgi:hypothetical protein